MNWRNFSLTLALCLVSGLSFAQANLLNAKTPDEIGKKTEAQMAADNDKPLPYGYVGDRDVLMGRKVWELIDLDERVNFPMYFPVEGDLGDNRKSLFQVLIDGIKDSTVAEVYDNSYFTVKKTLKDMETSFKRVDTLDAGREQLNNGEALSQEFVETTVLESADVSGYKVVGYWYFDKRQGEMKYRMLGLCPVVPDIFTMGSEDPDYIELFWVYFPAVRDLLHKNLAFNERNSAMGITFDHLLNSRRFSGVIYKEENVYGDRQIDQYLKDNAQMQLLESERVKEKIRNFEQDMWNY
jgi:gliding motility associated protien GldN